MSDLSELERPEVAQRVTDQRMRLSAAIRKGATTIKDAHHYLQGVGCGCVVAQAAVGYGHADAHGSWRALFEFVKKESGHSIDRLLDLEAQHIGGRSGLQIADWLEARGH